MRIIPTLTASLLLLLLGGCENAFDNDKYNTERNDNELYPLEAQEYSRFGEFIAANDDHVLISRNVWIDNFNPQGEVFLFSLDNNKWTENRMLQNGSLILDLSISNTFGAVSYLDRGGGNSVEIFSINSDTSSDTVLSFISNPKIDMNDRFVIVRVPETSSVFFYENINERWIETFEYTCNDNCFIHDVAINSTQVFVIEGYDPISIRVFELSSSISDSVIINLDVLPQTIQASDDFLLVNLWGSILLYDLTDISKSPITQPAISYIKDTFINNDNIIISDMKDDFWLETAKVTLYEILPASLNKMNDYQTNNPDRGTEYEPWYFGRTDRFGYKVVLNSNWLFIGCPLDDDTGRDAGSVYVYEY